MSLFAPDKGELVGSRASDHDGCKDCGDIATRARISGQGTMVLFIVKRDLSGIPPERLRLDQREIASACLQVKVEGKRIRYISSAVMPVDGRAVDVFGADSVDLVKQAHQSAAVPYYPHRRRRSGSDLELPPPRYVQIPTFAASRRRSVGRPGPAEGVGSERKRRVPARSGSVAGRRSAVLLDVLRDPRARPGSADAQRDAGERERDPP
jgi:hypothetical protein